MVQNVNLAVIWIVRGFQRYRVPAMEWLNEGQHIEHYLIQIWSGQKWVTVAEGRPIGHKKIDRFHPVLASRVRLNILAASGSIRVREFQLYAAGDRLSTPPEQ